MKRINYTLFLLLGIAIMYTGCDDDTIANLDCKIQSIEHSVSDETSHWTHTDNFQYDDQGLLVKLTVNSILEIIFEYNAQGLVTRMDYDYGIPELASAYIWKYNEGVLTEVEVFIAGTKKYSYFFEFDSLKRLTKLTSDNTIDYISYSWEYSGNSRNPTKRFYYILKSDSLPKKEYIVSHREYLFDNKKNPWATLQGFLVSPDNSEIIFGPIPENNIIQEDFFSADPDYLSEDYYYTIVGEHVTTYNYNAEGFPQKGITTDGYTPPLSQDDATFTYQVCE